MNSRRKKPNNFSTALRKLLKSKHIKQCELARYLGTCQPRVSQWVHCERIPKDNEMIEIAAFFGVSLDELWSDAG